MTSIFKQLKGFISFVILKLKGQEPLRVGECNQCGQCCRGFRVKSDGQWIKTRKQFDQLVQRKKEYARLFCVDEIDGYLNFSCTWLTTDGICKDHQNRLAICNEYPSTNRFYTGNELPDYCGYAIKAAVPFDKVLKKEMKQRR